MATTNLVTQTLGNSLRQSGNGTPNHTPPVGSLYTDKNTGVLYIYDNLFGWTNYNQSTFGNVYIDGNFTQTAIAAATTWYPLTGLTWVPYTGSSGITAGSNGVMTIKTNRNGRYYVAAQATLQYVATTTVYEVGISVNNGNPSTGFYCTNVPLSTSLAQFPIGTYLDLVANDTVQLKVRVQTGFAAGNIIVKYASINLNKIYT